MFRKAPHDAQDSASQWQPPQRPRNLLSSLIQLLFLLIIAVALIVPFTPAAPKLKKAFFELVEDLKTSKTKTVIQEKIKEVPKIQKVIERVVEKVEAPPPPLPEKFVPRKEADVASLFNGITINTVLQTDEGGYASIEREDPEAYRVQFSVSLRVPKASQSISELARINPDLPQILPGLSTLVESGKVSGFYHKLYENKTSLVKRELTRLNRIFDRHNFFDCETILEMRHPQSGRKALLIQSEMDVVADGSDGDRADSLDDYISLSDYYQPSTSYGWAKKTNKPNPLIAKWNTRIQAAKDEYAKKGLSAEKNRSLKALISQLSTEVKDMKERSYLIADSDPFIVISLLFKGYGSQNSYTPEIGDYGLVIHGNKIYPTICGDYGPTTKMGEASLYMAKAINAKATPYIRPENDLKVTYIIFPGTTEKPFGPPNLEHWKERCSAYLQEIGGLGSGYELHTWEDKFKQPEPPPPAATPTPESNNTSVTAPQQS
jgi:hypothetical protein